MNKSTKTNLTILPKELIDHKVFNRNVVIIQMAIKLIIIV